MTRRQTGPSAETRALVHGRAGGRCERCAGAGEHIHHRLARRMGGTRNAAVNLPSNLLLLCSACHLGWVEKSRSEALADGFLIHAGHDPAKIAVKLFGVGFVLLGDAGTYEQPD